MRPAPVDPCCDDVEAFVTPAGRKVSRQRHRHPADARPDIQDVVIRLESTELCEVAEELLARSLEIAPADEDHRFPFRRCELISVAG